MAARTQHVVTAALIVARTGSTERYFDRGTVLPEDVNAEERKRLVGLRLVNAQKSEEPSDPAKTQGQAPVEPAKGNQSPDQPPADPPK